MIELDTQIRDTMRSEVNHAIDVWRVILSDNFDIKYSYVKGSAIKRWESKIDYVPVFSDLDIHFEIKGEEQDDTFTLDKSINITKSYNEMFKEKFEKPFHVPRPQTMLMNRFGNKKDFISPKISSIKFIVGGVESMNLNYPDNDYIKKLAKQGLEEDYQYSLKMPYSLFDRHGLDFWQMLRRMNWRISPSVARLLIQILDDPLEIWAQNRTFYHKHLLDLGYDSLAYEFETYYLTGWDLFNADFRDDDLYRKIIKHGCNVIQMSHKIIMSIVTDNG